MPKSSRRALVTPGATTVSDPEVRDADYQRKLPAAAKAYASLQRHTALGLFDFGKIVDDLVGSTSYGTQLMAAVAEDLGAALSTIYRARQLYRIWGRREKLERCMRTEGADAQYHLSTEHYLILGRSKTPEEHARIAIERTYTPQQAKQLVAGQQVTEQGRRDNKVTSRNGRNQEQANDGSNGQNPPEDPMVGLRRDLDTCLERAQNANPNDSRLNDALTVAEQVVHELETKIQSQTSQAT